jgi:hypothetical protein
VAHGQSTARFRRFLATRVAAQQQGCKSNGESVIVEPFPPSVRPRSVLRSRRPLHAVCPATLRSVVRASPEVRTSHEML